MSSKALSLPVGLALAGLLATTVGAAQGAPAPQSNWLEKAKLSIAESEYHLKPAAAGWTAPNRAQSLRTTWADGVVTTTDRTEPTWSLQMSLTGIGRGRKLAEDRSSGYFCDRHGVNLWPAQQLCGATPDHQDAGLELPVIDRLSP